MSVLIRLKPFQVNQLLLRRIIFQFGWRQTRFALISNRLNFRSEAFSRIPVPLSHSPGHFAPIAVPSVCGHGQRPDPPEHNSEQASRQVALGQQQPEVPRMLHQSPTRLHQPLLQARRLGRLRFVTMKPTRGNSAPKWNFTFATTRRAAFQLAAW
jgi:hypothetical protein